MSKDKKDYDRKKKAVSWYAPILDGELGKSEDEDFLGTVVDPLKSRSLDGKHVTRAKLSKFSTSDKIPLSQKKTNSNSMDWLEGALQRRRSVTRIYKYNTQLLESISGGDTAYMSRMLAMGANPNATCRLNHVSACHLAAMYNHGALELLIKAGAESQRCDKLGNTPLHLAAWAGNAKQIAILLNLPKALQESIDVSISPEILEEVKRHSAAVQQLTNTPCKLNDELSTVPDAWSDGMEHNCRLIKEALPMFRQGSTALHAASARAQHHCVQLLIAAGADLCAQDMLCRMPLDIIGLSFYMGHKIDETSFRETLRTLLNAGGKFRSHSARLLDTVLHTAVELESVEAVEDLLNTEVSITAWNSRGLTAMHVCVTKQNKQILQLLANHEYSNENLQVTIIDTVDKWGYSVLRAAVKAGWAQGVCIALGAGANITLKAKDGETPLHAAAALGNMDILQEILTVAEFDSSIDIYNDKGHTALSTAISHNKIDAVKLLLKVGANVEKKTLNQANMIHIAAQYGNIEILEYLLEYNSHATAKMINSADKKTYTPLVYAVLNDHPMCVELLISKGAVVIFDVLYKNGINAEEVYTTPLHIAAIKNHFEIAKIITDNDIKTIHTANSVGYLPLHEACCHGNKNIISLLLNKGADLSARREYSKTKLTPIDMLMNNLSKPTEFMEDIFDSYITSKGMNLQESNSEVTVNYQVLLPNDSDRTQMQVIKALVNTGNRFNQNRLLLHPLMQSFLYLKWKSLLPFFYVTLALHVCFVSTLNLYVISEFYYKDNNLPVPFLFQSNVWKYIVYITICLIVLQEIVFIKIKNKRYWFSLEVWLKLGAIVLALLLLQVISWEILSLEWARLIATFALLVSWFEIMYLQSRFPHWGFYVLMFGKVANKVFKILLSFVFLIFGFSICFMIQFDAQEPFEDPWASLVKTIVMMTSEYDYQGLINKDNVAKISGSITILRVLFLIFLILLSMVLMNLIVGVAVNDVSYLEMVGNIKRLEKQVEFIIILSDVACHKFVKTILQRRLYTIWSRYQKLDSKITLRPREATCNYYKRFPAHLRVAIFEKAQLQEKRMDKDFGEMVFRLKLDEIHSAVVGKDETETVDVAMINRIMEEITHIRSDVELIKNVLQTNRRRTICSKNSCFM